MKFKTRVAGALRKAGLDSFVDSTRLRGIVGAPLYKKHVQQLDVKEKPQDTESNVHGARVNGDARRENATEPKKDDVVPRQKLLSVVVPAYNVEEYLEECVASILGQDFKEIEVIIVDDGSTDNTQKLAHELAARDRRIQVISQPNAGLGAARNTGLAASSAEFVTFVDSDDTVTKVGYQKMMDRLLKSGSAVAVAGIDRFDENRHWTPAWVKEVHSVDRTSIRGEEFPPLMWDVFACNKIFKKDMFVSVVGGFPVGTLYEDQEVTAKLYVSDAKIDVLTCTVYNWRLRSDGSSITQQKNDPVDLAQRVAVAKRVEQIYAAADTEFYRSWLVKVLEEDFSYYIWNVPRAGEEFWQILSECLCHFWGLSDEAIVRRIRPSRRWMSYLAATGAKIPLEKLLVQFEEWGEKWEVKQDDDGLKCKVPACICSEVSGMGLDDVDPGSMKPKSAIERIVHEQDGTLVIGGYAFVENLAEDTDIAAHMLPLDQDGMGSGNESIPLDVRRVRSDRANRDARNGWVDHSRDGFELTIPSRLIDDVALAGGGVFESGPYRLVIELRLGETRWQIDSVHRRTDGSAGDLYPGRFTGSGSYAVISGRGAAGVEIRIMRPRFLAENMDLSTRGRLTGYIRLSNAEPSAFAQGISEQPLRLCAVRAKKELWSSPVPMVEDGVWRIDSVIPKILPAEGELVSSISVELRGGSSFRAAVACDLPPDDGLNGGTVRLSRTGYGYLQFEAARVYAVVERLSGVAASNELVIEGRFAANPEAERIAAPTFALVGEQVDLFPRSVEYRNDGFFKAVFGLDTINVDGRTVSIVPGRYTFEVLLPSGRKVSASLWVPVGPSVETELPIEMNVGISDVDIVASDRARALIIFVVNRESQRSKVPWEHRERVDVYRGAPAKIGTKPTVLFESFGGRGVSDSPLAIDRSISRLHPEVRRFWSVVDHSVSVPSGAIPLVVGTEEWYEVLRSANLLVNNNNFPAEYSKSKGQHYIQTWHGTPLKKIGLDVPQGNLSLRYRDLMEREATKYWDLLLAQSEWAAPVLKRAFGYQGPVFSEGYPRNDAIVRSADATMHRRRVREYFSIGDNQTVVLYAPTWRDTRRDPSGRYSRIDMLDLGAFAHTLGSRFQVLYRSHVNTASSKAKRYPRSVIDVGMYPDVNDLILASDVLVTDYSSIMFDYCVTMKPIVYYAPDFDTYMGRTRGSYFDLDKLGAAPVLRSRGEVLEAVRGVVPGELAGADSYLRFRNNFARRDDGSATDRLMDFLEVTMPSMF